MNPELKRILLADEYGMIHHSERPDLIREIAELTDEDKAYELGIKAYRLGKQLKDSSLQCAAFAARTLIPKFNRETKYSQDRAISFAKQKMHKRRAEYIFWLTKKQPTLF